MKKKIVSCIIYVLLMNTVCLLPVSAFEKVPEQVSINTIAENIILFADVIEIRYRTYNGVRQYRRWNRTKNCWVDSRWFNI